MIKSRFPEVKVLINSHNGGFGYGHNRMLKIIHSKYHLVINPDIIFEEDIIEKLVNYMEMHPEVGMITPKILNRDGTEQFLPKKRPFFSLCCNEQILNHSTTIEMSIQEKMKFSRSLPKLIHVRDASF